MIIFEFGRIGCNCQECKANVSTLQLFMQFVQLSKMRALLHCTMVKFTHVFFMFLTFLGLSAGLARQATYTTTRLGLYSWLFEFCSHEGRSPSFAIKAGLGMTSGGIASLFGFVFIICISFKSLVQKSNGISTSSNDR